MLNIKFIKEKVKIIKEVRHYTLLDLVAHSKQANDATLATDTLKAHIRAHYMALYRKEGTETKIKKFLSKTLKCDILKDDLSGVGKYYPRFLMTKEPRGMYTTAVRLIGSDEYIFYNDKFIFNGVAPRDYNNFNYVLAHNKRIEECNKGQKFKHKDEKSKMFNFGFKLHVLKVPVRDNTFYMGIELEVGRKNTSPMGICADVLDDLNEGFKEGNGYSFAILKHDGSIPSHGFEIVSAPATLMYHKTAWNKFFNNSAKQLRSYTFNSCGMHVHVSRNTFTDSGSSLFKNPAGHIGRFINFYNKKDNRAFIQNIAGRSENSYTRFEGKKVTSVFKNHSTGDRYQAVNLNNLHTLEIRIFRGNVKKEGFMKNLEFVHASVEFTRQAGYGVGKTLDKPTRETQGYEDCESLSYVEFIKWIQEPVQVAEYPYLTKWLKARDLITTNMVKLQEDINLKDTRKDQPLISNFLNDVA